MKIEQRTIEDLKNERTDVAPALQPYLRLVPILFYAMLAGGILLSAFFLLLLRNAAVAEKQWNAETARLKKELAEVQAGRDAVEKEAHRANDIVAWVQGSRDLQPLVVAMVRSIEGASTIAGLGLARDPVAPAQIKLNLKLNTQGSKQLDATLQEIASRNFRAYSPNQTQAQGEVDYEATLLYQSARAEDTNPTQPAVEAKGDPK
jgi:hypothetical protein